MLESENKQQKKQAQEYNEYCQKEIEKDNELKRLSKQKQRGVMQMILEEADKVKLRK